MKGVFIAIEGTDGSGKGTQHRLLVSRLQKEGYRVHPVDFPQYELSVFGALAGRMFKGDFGPMDHIDPHLAAVVLAADRFKASSSIRNALENGVNVIANRYTLSNMAHQTARMPTRQRSSFVKLLETLEYSDEGFGIPRPDLYIYLHVPPEITQKLVSKKGERTYLSGKRVDIAEADRHHQVQSAKMYQKLAKTLPNVITVECSTNGELRSEQHIHEAIWDLVQSALGCAS